MRWIKSSNGKYVRVLAALCIIIAISILAITIIRGRTEGIFKSGKLIKLVNIPAENFKTADANAILDEENPRLIVINNFHAAKLNNDRSLHIYLPPGYYKNQDKRYPVLYAQDGKNIYDISDWSKESLDMHVTADKLISEGKIDEIIIVGIDNIGDMRLNEYAHWDGVDGGREISAQGLLYEDFVINDVKPFIDKYFRTLTDRDNTALMGESIGGFATFNIGYRHPEVFSKLAMLSPYLGWGNGRLYNELTDGEYRDKKPLKMWIDVGSTETEFFYMTAQGGLLLLNKGYKYPNELVCYEVPGGTHSEGSWKDRIESVLLYLYGYIGKQKSVDLFIDESISLSSKQPQHINAVVTYDSGFKMSDIYGSFKVDNPEVLKVENMGGNSIPLKEGTTNVTFTSSEGLTAAKKITVTK